jgi:dTDP-4-amino-4,6-dideoxygalactose transaminase
LNKLKIRENTQWNYSYYPLIFKSEEELLRVQQQLNKQQIFPRRYFYPSLNTIEYSKGVVMSISESIASRILCLPLSDKIETTALKQICSIINI